MELSVKEKEEILNILSQLYKAEENQSSLNFNSPYEALIAVMLSAQTTDERVNKVTPALFEYHNTPEKMIELTEEELIEYIKTCGLKNTKAKNILKTSQLLVDKFNSEVPRTKEEILTLPGVGSKTANVVLANAYGIPGMGVDTHIKRVSTRTGLAKGTTPEKIEKELCELIPMENWIKAHRWLIRHGRRICKARKPLCDECQVKNICIYFNDLDQN